MDPLSDGVTRVFSYNNLYVHYLPAIGNHLLRSYNFGTSDSYYLVPEIGVRVMSRALYNQIRCTGILLRCFFILKEKHARNALSYKEGTFNKLSYGLIYDVAKNNDLHD